uniref:Putative secreted peptide n=1 Tax=Anopheles braziliensis TaxID=58242 RepID=A0A2M3ZQZ2_9DIPT
MIAAVRVIAQAMTAAAGAAVTATTTTTTTTTAGSDRARADRTAGRRQHAVATDAADTAIGEVRGTGQVGGGAPRVQAGGGMTRTRAGRTGQGNRAVPAGRLR